MRSLFDRMGGEDALTAAVPLFYGKVMAVESVGQFFSDIDMDSQIDKQIAFMTMAFGGPHSYSGKDLATAHAPLVKRGLVDEHFDVILDCLRQTLEELEIAPSIVGEILAAVEATRDQVFGRAGA